jgi:hypothetical protein
MIPLPPVGLVTCYRLLNILSRVRGSVTSNCGFLDFIVTFIGRYYTFTLNSNKSHTYCVLS